ncbi:hypothetical protein A5N15_02640 [Rothia kristinae]|uniref:Uncharacterized protein n=1 Tax=Rothia kristinae TaxID=37923 RepID=A0A657IVM3_9MICC|nr:hypothetical protein A5N15_02640 [Rothia kristinae]
MTTPASTITPADQGHQGLVDEAQHRVAIGEGLEAPQGAVHAPFALALLDLPLQGGGGLGAHPDGRLGGGGARVRTGYSG